MLAAIVPVKTLPQAKGRLARVLHPAERRALVQTMLGDVLAALLATRGIARVGVISADADVLAQARALGAESLRDQGADLNAALAQAARYYAAEGAQGVLVLPADVPLATPAALEQLIAAAPEQGAAIVPSRDGGTNALLVRPPLALPFRFGPGSLAQHERAAQERGMPFVVADIAGVNLDVDQADDLLLLAEREGSTATQRLLRELSVTERVMCV
jgi:2-phospho-L-lactate guanylyltransferase